MKSAEHIMDSESSFKRKYEEEKQLRLEEKRQRLEAEERIKEVEKSLKEAEKSIQEEKRRRLSLEDKVETLLEKVKVCSIFIDLLNYMLTLALQTV